LQGVEVELSIYTRVRGLLAQLLSDEEGQGLTEYALILALIAIVAIAALTLLGGSITSALSTVANSI
jgi:pilus assembly protein Flp/PilA